MEKPPLELDKSFCYRSFEEKEPRFFLLHRSLQIYTWEIIGAERFCCKGFGKYGFSELEKRERERVREDDGKLV
jgi:hypothetical protein